MLKWHQVQLSDSEAPVTGLIVPSWPVDNIIGRGIQHAFDQISMKRHRFDGLLISNTYERIAYRGRVLGCEYAV